MSSTACSRYNLVRFMLTAWLGKPPEELKGWPGEDVGHSGRRKDRARGVDKDSPASVGLKFEDEDKEKRMNALEAIKKNLGLGTIMLLLALCIPAGILLELSHANPIIIFVVAAVGVAPLAGMIGQSTESLAEKSGARLGRTVKRHPWAMRPN
ncbi:MAG: hypothetical protein M5U34_05435 [Chloroflexi bacterium]|nr:hypothetical protein [Chloroflexota bacterium]